MGEESPPLLPPTKALAQPGSHTLGKPRISIAFLAFLPWQAAEGAHHHCPGRHRGLSRLSERGGGFPPLRGTEQVHSWGAHPYSQARIYLEIQGDQCTHHPSWRMDAVPQTDAVPWVRGDQGWDGGFTSRLDAVATCSFALLLREEEDKLPRQGMLPQSSNEFFQPASCTKANKSGHDSYEHIPIHREGWAPRGTGKGQVGHPARPLPQLCLHAARMLSHGCQGGR